ncbi:MAG: enoyl-CoA hydratase [Gammaproteobacteria bacterium]|nr:enoyl-CoA hydratase [Gammaproteobacteria bacterium]
MILLDTVAEGVCRLTLNNPQSLNVLSRSMLDRLQVLLAEIQQNQDCKVLIIAAKGKAFCVGHDLREMYEHPSQEYYEQLFADCGKVMMLIQQLPQVVVAMVQGVATAAGCQLVSMCDLALASTTSKFAVSGINYGLYCSTPSVGLSRNVARKKALEMLLTGDFISADQALEFGLINYAVDDLQLEELTLNLCNKIAIKPHFVLSLGKRLFYQQIEVGIQAAYQLAQHTMACNAVHEVTQAGFKAFVDKKAPPWRASH